MKDNLENIVFDEVISGSGKKYSDIRLQLKPAYKKVAWDIFKGYFFLFLIITTDILLIQFLLFNPFIGIPLSALAIGYCLAYLHLFIHAAAHYELHPHKSKNDLLSDLFIGVFFGIAVKKYRKIHWLHHSNLGLKNDSEHSYFNELNLLFLLKCITGYHTLAVILSRFKRPEKINTQKFSPAYPLYVLIVQLLILSLLYITGGLVLVLSWLGGLLIVFPLLAALRQLIEHRDIEASGKINYQQTDHGKISRLFGKGFIDSSFGAAGFNKHLLHHWDPTISYTRLEDVEEFLMDCPKTASVINESKTSYIKIFIALFKI
jgi:fatty acid desaturase